jgi:hypothetical protein
MMTLVRCQILPVGIIAFLSALLSQNLVSIAHADPQYAVKTIEVGQLGSHASLLNSTSTPVRAEIGDDLRVVWETSTSPDKAIEVRVTGPGGAVITKRQNASLTGTEKREGKDWYTLEATFSLSDVATPTEGSRYTVYALLFGSAPAEQGVQYHQVQAGAFKVVTEAGLQLGFGPPVAYAHFWPIGTPHGEESDKNEFAAFSGFGIGIRYSPRRSLPLVDYWQIMFGLLGNDLDLDRFGGTATLGLIEVEQVSAELGLGYIGRAPYEQGKNGRPALAVVFNLNLAKLAGLAH